MANNRLYIYDPETHARICIAKTNCHKWESSDKQMNEFLNSVYCGGPDELGEITKRLQFKEEDGLT